MRILWLQSGGCGGMLCAGTQDFAQLLSAPCTEAMPPRESPLHNLPSVDDATWLDVIQKMDEVELETKNAQLEESQRSSSACCRR